MNKLINRPGKYRPKEYGMSRKKGKFWANCHRSPSWGNGRLGPPMTKII